jgi:signal transduction histidine kinase
MKILSVDDKVENLYLLESVLKGAGSGYEVVSAHNGVEALQRLEQQPIDLIISDILMPQMDGFELCHQVKGREALRHIPFVFYTATYTDKKDEELGLRLGASRFIIKPLEPEPFLVILREVLEEYKTKRLAAAPPSTEKGEVLLGAYNRTLVRKLDRKVQQLEQARDELARANAELEQKVQERTAQLREANASLQGFTSTAAHDLRSPLTAIRNFSEIVAEQYGEKLGLDGRSILGRVMASADQMDRLLNDLLEYSKISQAELKLGPVSLWQAVSEALALLDGDIQGKDAVFTVSEPLPEVVGHRATVVVLVKNLVSNALKFSQHGVRPQIRIWGQRRQMEPASLRTSEAQEPGLKVAPGSALDAAAVRLWVEDNGIGIAPQHLERIFGAFERLHGKEDYPGTGLGLAIVREGAERMGGGAGVESELGKGSRFWVELRTP